MMILKRSQPSCREAESCDALNSGAGLRRKLLFTACISMMLSTDACNRTPNEAKDPSIATAPEADHRIIEGYPASLAHELNQRQQDSENAASGFKPQPSWVLVKSALHWTPGKTVTVAFRGGNPDLYKKIEYAAKEWTKPGYANLTLDFRNKDGTFRTWSTSDKDYAASIRVAFETGVNGGYWSVVGNQSIDPSISAGHPNQTSLNLGGFDTKLPTDWQAVVVHEFGHAIGFQHEHQSPAAGCDFRYNDDPGYVKTLDADGWYTVDDHQRRPGLYTYLGGKSNYWPSTKVDFNLRALKSSSAFSYGAYDPKSIMMYYFDSSMFVEGAKSPCAIATENTTISAEDKAGVSHAYQVATGPGAQNLPSFEALKILATSSKAPMAFRQSMQLMADRIQKPGPGEPDK